MYFSCMTKFGQNKRLIDSYIFINYDKKGGMNLAIVWIILGIILFLIGFLTPISSLFTLPISIALVVWGIFLAVKNRKIV